jgi:hypothetical protein
MVLVLLFAFAVSRPLKQRGASRKPLSPLGKRSKRPLNRHRNRSTQLGLLSQITKDENSQSIALLTSVTVVLFTAIGVALIFRGRYLEKSESDRHIVEEEPE